MGSAASAALARAVRRRGPCAATRGDAPGLAGQGDFNMVFRAANPIWAILAALPPTLITFAASRGGPLVDAAFSAANDNNIDRKAA